MMDRLERDVPQCIHATPHFADQEAKELYLVAAGMRHREHVLEDLSAHVHWDV